MDAGKTLTLRSMTERLKYGLALWLTMVMALTARLPVFGAIRTLEDVNADAVVDIDDVNAVVNVILRNNTETALMARADVDGDGVVDIDDLNAVIAAIVTHRQHEVRDGYDYVWNDDALPEVHLSVSLDEWNRLLALYDADRLTKQFVKADVTFVTGDDTTRIAEAGLRLRGNGSRRRPEGVAGQMHTSDSTVWHPTGFGVNFSKFHKDDAHTLSGIRKVHLRYFYHDPTYVRELYCYRLLAQYGVWTAPRDNYCRLWVHVQGDSHEAYYGVYTLLEPIDERYLTDRQTHFGAADGYLWKCGQGVADLRRTGDSWFGTDNDEAPYVLKTRIDEFEVAKAQFRAFTDSLNSLNDEDFARWIPTVCDVELLLRTYAVVVTVGNWDDYWNNSNNYYLYFNTTDVNQYQFYFIPHDLDETLGSSYKVFAITDTGRQDPMHWGMDERNPLIARVLKIERYRKFYLQCLRELVDPRRDLFHYDASVRRIKAWHDVIAPFVPSDVDRDNVLADQPSKLGNRPLYRLLTDNPQWNFFRVRTAVIDSIPD